MATPKQCSMCTKVPGSMYCTGCEKYFCWKDLKIHREGMFIEMDKIVEERNHLQDAINNILQINDQSHPLIQQIEKWKNTTIEKIKQIAEQVRQQTIQLLNARQIKIDTEFKSFSQELAHLRDTENYVEHDLTRLNQKISQFKQDLKQSTQPTTIELHTQGSDSINWNGLIYVEEKQTYSKLIY
jgi:seryl-tRNA synthetase